MKNVLPIIFAFGFFYLGGSILFLGVTKLPTRILLIGIAFILVGSLILPPVKKRIAEKYRISENGFYQTVLFVGLAIGILFGRTAL